MIGETTGGGAHPTERRRFANLGVVMSLPYGRAINPITGTNWEGTGVAPDIEVDQGDALDVAMVKALQTLIGKETIPEFQQQLRWELESRQVARNPIRLTDKEMHTYVGTFGPRKISLVDGVLYYQREDMPRHKMIPVGSDRFVLTDVSDFRLEFIRDDSGQIVAVIGHYLGGASDRHEKNQ